MLLVGCNNTIDSKERQHQYKSIAEKAFITTWKTDQNITIPTVKDGYNYNIDWGDGKSDSNVKGDITHNYESAGEYTVLSTLKKQSQAEPQLFLILDGRLKMLG